MFRSFLVITFRILWRSKVTSFVNIFSLSVGITAFIFIMLYVQHEMSIDKFHTNYDRIYRLEGDSYGQLPPIFGYHLKDNVPDIGNVAFVSMLFADVVVSYIPAGDPKGRKDINVNYGMADSTTFDVFSFPMIKGNPRTALKQPMSIVLTESTAKKLFGDEEPIGKSIISSYETYYVTGVIKDVKTSHMEFDILISASTFARLFPERNINDTAPNGWAWSATYLLTNRSVDAVDLEDRINKALAEINNGLIVDTKFQHFSIRPLKDVYFDGETQRVPYGLHGDFQMIIILITIGIFLLALSGINYVNLTTARSTARSKEIAVKRVTGSSANLLRLQLMGESVIISLISLAIALTIVQLLLPKFREMTGVDIDLQALFESWAWLKIIVGGIFIGVLAGIYPAFFLTAIQPLQLIKGEGIRRSRSFFRSVLMTFQFTLSVVMVVAIIVIYRQLTFVQNAELGFDKEHIITLTTPGDRPNEFDLRREFKARLQKYAGIEGIAFSYGNAGMSLSDSPTVEINGELRSAKMILIDEEYLDVMGIKIVEGRQFSIGTSRKLIFNETASNEFGVTTGHKIYMPSPFDTIPDPSRDYVEVIGIVKDFHFRSFHEKIEPLAFACLIRPGSDVSIKVSSSDFTATIKAIEDEYKSVWPSEGFSYKFINETFNRQYNKDQKLALIIGYFAGLAVIIACLGLFALSSFMVSSRIKEIGVRKVLGASVGKIYSMLSWDFLKWILVAIIIACPIGWYTMNAWLNTFAYHIAIGPDIFIVAATLAISIALLTITWQSLKVANANPVDSLRYE